MLIVERRLLPGDVTAKVGNPPAVAVHLTELLTFLSRAVMAGGWSG